MKKKLKYISTMLLIAFVFHLVPVQAVEEEPANVYTGTAEADAVLKNMDFRDVESQGESYWARKAIYDMAALSIVKGYGEKTFNASAPVTRVQALALIYRAIGREADAQQVAEIIEQQRAQDERRYNAVEVWADGYLQLAANDGLITGQQLQDALDYDQEWLDPEYNFIKTLPAQRQEVGEWLAKALNLAPVYNQQEVFNSFKDWRQADPLKVPYLESVLKAKIINGTADGFLNPSKSVRRDEMAQILKNAELFILARQGLTVKHGYIEGITENADRQIGKTVTTTLIKVRNEEGRLDHIRTEQVQDAQANIAETSRDTITGEEKEIIVLGKGIPGTGSLLKQGDRIRYIADESKTIKVVRVLSSGEETTTQIGDIVDVDYEKRHITVKKDDGKTVTYRTSDKAEIIINRKTASFEELLLETPAELTLRNDLVVKVEVKPKEGALDENEVTGIVEEINPSLGYISLYDETGKKSFNLLRIYSFLNPSFIEVIRNGNPATIDEVQPGDSVFLKLDEAGHVIEIASSENYIVKYGTIMSKTPTSVLVQYEDGSQQLLNINGETFIAKNRKLVSYASVKPGNRVKLVIHQTEQFTALKELTVEKGDYNISNIYKANIYFYDPYDHKLIVNNLMQLQRGQWALTTRRGDVPVILNEEVSVQAGDRTLRLDDISRYYADSEVYIAVERGLGGVEQAVLISLKNADEPEKRYDDVIKSVTAGTGEFKMDLQYETFKYTDGTIIVKDGKLISGNNLDADDEAYVVANRNYGSGQYNAAVIEVKDKTPADSVVVYRGRIKEMNENQDFTVQSFAQLEGMRWVYYNTPKTFKVSKDTVIADANGVVNNRDFNEYSSKGYIGMTVYIVADDLDTMMVSEAPYGTRNFKGEAYLDYGETVGSTLTLKNAQFYDQAQGQWDQSNDVVITLREDTIILKDGKIISKSQIKRRDVVRVIKKYTTTAGEGLIILVEN